MRIVIRADASPDIGTGHIMRCLALAQTLRDGGDDVELATVHDLGPIADRWRGEEATLHRIPAEAGSERDAALTAGIATGAAWIVLDGYTFDTRYRARLASVTRLLVVDDEQDRDVRADLIVNGNLHATSESYPDAAGRVLAGPRFALLRREFRAAREAGHRGGVLVSMGGADPGEHTLPILAALSERRIHGRVIVGTHVRADAVLRHAASALGWDPIVAPADMAAVLSTAGLAVVGAGSTTLECLAMGVPMVAVRTAPNQAPAAAELRRRGLALVAEGDDAAGVSAATEELLGDAARRMAMREAGPSVIDGRGALRVAGAMREALLELRPATHDDAGRLLAWRNDEVTRLGSFDSALIGTEEHAAWFERALTTPSTILGIAELEGVAVGVMRLEVREDAAEISITVAPEARAMGLATPMIRAGLATAARRGIERVDALIRSGNTVSRRAFASAGFVEAERRDRAGVPGDAVLMVASLSGPR